MISVLLSFSLVILIASSFAITTIAHSPKHTNKLTLRLIHRYSIFPTSYNTKLSFSDPDIADDTRATLIPMEDGTVFLVNISIGEPPVPQLVAMDTGSSLAWVHCTDCERCNIVFDPKKSSTYRKLSPDSHQCIRVVYNNQEKDFQCIYEIRYQDLSMSSGVLASEKFTFLTSTGGMVEVPDVMFGCALNTRGSVRDFNGILGLEAPNKYCLAARVGNKFSYCIGNISDTQYMYNQLVLGDGAILQGDSTPMQTRENHYFLTLEGISVGEKQLTINQDYFFHYNVAIDSGTTQTLLVKSAYEPLMTEVKNLLNGMLQPIRDRNAGDQLCYLGNLETDLKGFPIVTLHLADGADIVLDVEAMFQRSTDGSAFCMAVVESSENLIGIRAQQYYNVGFDLDAMRVSFQRIDCELLED